MALGLENGFVDTMAGARSSIAGAVPTTFSATGTGAAGSAADLMREQNALLKAILNKDTTVQIGDDVIGRANARYTRSRGAVMNGGLANAY